LVRAPNSFLEDSGRRFLKKDSNESSCGSNAC
jgi:hypothetical protein